MITPPRYLTDALLAWLRATPDAPALLVTASGVKAVKLTPLVALPCEGCGGAGGYDGHALYPAPGERGEGCGGEG